MPAVELAWGDQRRRTGSGGALEGLRDDALYKYTFTLLYFTLQAWCDDDDDDDDGDADDNDNDAIDYVQRVGALPQSAVQ